MNRTTRWAIHLNNWRIVPRLALVAFMAFTGYACWWFMQLLEPTTQHVSFITALIAGASVFANLYLKSGSVVDPDAVPPSADAGIPADSGMDPDELADH